MNPWIETTVVFLAAAGGVLLGLGSSKLRKPYWSIGYFIPLVFILLIALAHRKPAMAVSPPLSWLVLGRSKFALFGFVITMVLTTPLSRLPQKRLRVLICVLMAVMVWGMAAWPVISPVFNRAALLRLKTKMDADGICLQSNDYTCGAAAAVTGLRRLGFPAEEGDIAILARTSLASGTEPNVLADELQKRYGADGLSAEYRVFKNLDELKDAGITLAVVRFTFMVDHYVTVLEITEAGVVVGDPLVGRVVLTPDEFLKKWRLIGVVLRRRS